MAGGHRDTAANAQGTGQVVCRNTVGNQPAVFDFTNGQVQRHDGVTDTGLDRAFEDMHGVDLHDDFAHGQPVLFYRVLDQRAGAVTVGLTGKYQRPGQRLRQANLTRSGGVGGIGTPSGSDGSPSAMAECGTSSR